MADISSERCGALNLAALFTLVLSLIESSFKSGLSRNRSLSQPLGNHRNSASEVLLSSSVEKFYFGVHAWEAGITSRTPSKRASAKDVLKVLETSKFMVAENIRNAFDRTVSLLVTAQHKIFEDDTDIRYFEIELHRGLDECLIDLERQVGTIREAYAVEIGHLEVAGQARHTSTIVLSMDGGGVRSYSSLMILEALMNKVYRLLISAEHPLKDLGAPVAALPQEYFDYIFGSSSGGLLAIMLGRLGMNVRETRDAFKTYASAVFSRPRLLTTLFPLWPRAKYSQKTLQRAVLSVIDSFGEQGISSLFRNFVSQDNDCKTGVIAVDSSKPAAYPYLFRSYSHIENPEIKTLLRNPGIATSMPIWQVAAATTAVPFLFDPVLMDGMSFCDGGIMFNNPTIEAFYEVKAMCASREIEQNIFSLSSKANTVPEGSQREEAKEAASPRNESVILTVSIGTGNPRPAKLAAKRGVFGPVLSQFEFHKASIADTQRVHEDMLRIDQKEDSIYHRFDVLDGMEGIWLDSWRSFDHIEAATKAYLEKKETQKALEMCAMDLIRLQASRL